MCSPHIYRAASVKWLLVSEKHLAVVLAFFTQLVQSFSKCLQAWETCKVVLGPLPWWRPLPVRGDRRLLLINGTWQGWGVSSADRARFLKTPLLVWRSRLYEPCSKLKLGLTYRDCDQLVPLKAGLLWFNHSVISNYMQPMDRRMTGFPVLLSKLA